MSVENLLKNKRVISISLSLLFFWLLFWQDASAAILQINSKVTTLFQGETTTLNVAVNSQNVAINNAEATIEFSKDIFEVVSISKTGSIFSLWVDEPSFSNSSGLITFNGGLPNPGFNGTQGSVLSIVVRAKKAGQGSFNFLGATVRANDGLGTNVLNDKQGKVLAVSLKEKPAEAETITSALQISSPTHPNQDEWYKIKDAKFVWNVSADSDAVQTSIGNNPNSIPHVTYSPPISEKMVEDLEDGIWYFKVRSHQNDTWGTVSTYIVRIDRTTPEKKEVTFSYDDNSKILKISSDIQDLTSGINRYEIFVNDVLIKSLSPKDFKDGDYNFGFNASGDNTVKLVAIDQAGNSVEAQGTFYATGAAAPYVYISSELVSAYKPLPLNGQTQNPNMEVRIKARNLAGEIITASTKSGNDKSFYVFLPSLVPGEYEIWAETGTGEKIVSSRHVFIKATERALITIGEFTITAIYASIIFVVLLAILLVIAYYLGYRMRPKKGRSRE